MRRIKKIFMILKMCLRQPSLIKRGFHYMKHYGVRKFIYDAKMRTDENYNKRYKLGILGKSKVSYYQKDIKFSIIMPVYNVEPKWLEKAIRSIQDQTYKNWELCIVDDCSTDDRTREYVRKIDDKKIKVVMLDKNEGISKASNIASSRATGNYLLLMDNDDVITPNALLEFAQEIVNSSPDVLYSDQDIVDVKGRKREPLCKPDWSPDLFLSQMYVGHLLGFKKELFEQVGGFRTEYNGSQDYDLLLRMSEKTSQIKHIPKILYSWRDLPSSTAANPESKPYAQTAGLKAIQGFLDAKYGENRAVALETENLFVYDVRYLLDEEPLVSIIIPIKDHVEMLKRLLKSIFEKTTYANYEIIILNNNSEETSTLDYLDEIKRSRKNVKALDAFYEFNWSKLNNQGIEAARGDVFVFMNNDMEVISEEWLTRLVEKAVRKDVGVVGGLLLYEDDTIQHAGVVVGIGGWADHIYKGMRPVHYGSPFVSPLVTRNITACTGALMAISRETINKIGRFSEDFLICGSDIEICVRALKRGLVNIYDPNVRLYHYESKTRDSFIPDIDFKMSFAVYEEYRLNGDPYYNQQLDYDSVTPKLAAHYMQKDGYDSAELEQNGFIEVSSNITTEKMDVRVVEIEPYTFRREERRNKRLNLLVPSINKEHVFGGIATALKFYEALAEELGYDKRIILTDAEPNKRSLAEYKGNYLLVKPHNNSIAKNQIVPYSNRYQVSLPVSENDYFVFTGWWTAYCAIDAYREFEKAFGVSPNPFIYLIQDYEPGFYAWSTRYMLADSTYRSEYPVIAVFNSSLLKEFFDIGHYQFYRSFVFEPVLNNKLKEILRNNQGKLHKKKQILVYGRPGTERNAFELLVEALRKWVKLQEDIEEWNILSAGEMHGSVELGSGKQLVSVGKLSIEEYASVLLESFAGISLMVSPHPSYPPLEMSVFGVKVITNVYANKDLSKFNHNIVSLYDVSPSNIARQLNEVCIRYKKEQELRIHNDKYTDNPDVFGFIKEIPLILEEGERL